MASKKSKAKKSGKKKASAGGGLKGIVAKGAKALGGGGSGGGTGVSRRSKGPSYWANKVLVAKLKAKYNRIKYAGVGR